VIQKIKPQNNRNALLSFQEPDGCAIVSDMKDETKKTIVIGIDLGGTNVRAAAVTEDGQIVSKLKKPTPKTAADLKVLLLEIVDSLSGGQAAALTLASAGVVDARDGKVQASPNLEAVVGQPLKNFIQEAAALPVSIVNDAAAAALGEKWLGAGRPFDDFLLLTLGTGIGGGVIHRGNLLDVAAEFGHMSIDKKGPLCHCGRHGCLEAYASATAVVDRAVQELNDERESLVRGCCDGNYYKVTSEIIYDTALDGDIMCREILKDAGSNLGVGVANLVNIFSPQAVIFSGGLLGAWNFIYPEVASKVSKLSFQPLSSELKILRSELSGDAGVLGAARLAFDGLNAKG